MKKIIFVGLAFCAAQAEAQTSVVVGQPVVAVARTAVTGTSSYLPSNTEVDLTLNSEISSKKSKEGDMFTLSVAHDVMLGDYIVIPKGTRANGKVVYRTGKGAFGKSAKMEIEMVNLDLGNRSIPLSGKFRQEGQGNTGATVGTAVAVGVFSAFVTGRSAVFEQGREFRAYTRDPLPVALAQEVTTPIATSAPAPAVQAAPVMAPVTAPAASN